MESDILQKRVDRSVRGMHILKIDKNWRCYRKLFFVTRQIHVVLFYRNGNSGGINYYCLAVGKVSNESDHYG